MVLMVAALRAGWAWPEVLVVVVVGGGRGADGEEKGSVEAVEGKDVRSGQGRGGGADEKSTRLQNERGGGPFAFRLSLRRRQRQSRRAPAVPVTTTPNSSCPATPLASLPSPTSTRRPRRVHSRRRRVVVGRRRPMMQRLHSDLPLPLSRPNIPVPCVIQPSLDTGMLVSCHHGHGQRARSGDLESSPHDN